MRNRLTKQAMGLNDSPTTMHVEQKNPDVSKYETGDPSSWGEDVHMDSPWELENSQGRAETGHPKKVREEGKQYTYASMVREAKDLEGKALRCLKMAEVLLGDDAPADVIERQAVDFMTMSNKSVLSSLRRMREFEEQISETRVAKIVDAVLEVIAEEEEEMEEEKKEASEETTVEAKEEEKEAEEEDKEEAKCATESEETTVEASEDTSEEDAKIAAVVEAVLAVMAKEEEKEEKEEEMKEAKEEEKEEEKEAKEEEKEEEMKEAKEEKEEAKEEEKEAKEEEMKEAKEEKEEEKEAKEEEMKEEMKEATEESSSMNVSFEEGNDVLASDEDMALLSQLFNTKEADQETLEKKEAKIKTLKNVTASSSEGDEISKLSSLWSKDY